jgi:hypothetical protein
MLLGHLKQAREEMQLVLELYNVETRSSVPRHEHARSKSVNLHRARHLSHIARFMPTSGAAISLDASSMPRPRSADPGDCERACVQGMLERNTDRGERTFRAACRGSQFVMKHSRAIGRARFFIAGRNFVRDTLAGRIARPGAQRPEAEEVLAPIYASFTEGWATADLVTARELLDEVGGQAGRPRFRFSS